MVCRGKATGPVTSIFRKHLTIKSIQYKFSFFFKIKYLETLNFEDFRFYLFLIIHFTNFYFQIYVVLILFEVPKYQWIQKLDSK